MPHVLYIMIDKVIVIVKIYYPMHLINCLDNLTCCYIDLLWLNLILLVTIPYKKEDYYF